MVNNTLTILLDILQICNFYWIVSRAKFSFTAYRPFFLQMCNFNWIASRPVFCWTTHWRSCWTFYKFIIFIELVLGQCSGEQHIDHLVGHSNVGNRGRDWRHNGYCHLWRNHTSGNYFLMWCSHSLQWYHCLLHVVQQVKSK